MGNSRRLATHAIQRPPCQATTGMRPQTTTHSRRQRHCHLPCLRPTATRTLPSHHPQPYHPALQFHQPSSSHTLFTLRPQLRPPQATPPLTATHPRIRNPARHPNTCQPTNPTPTQIQIPTPLRTTTLLAVRTPAVGPGHGLCPSPGPLALMHPPVKACALLVRRALQPDTRSALHPGHALLKRSVQSPAEAPLSHSCSWARHVVLAPGRAKAAAGRQGGRRSTG